MAGFVKEFRLKFGQNKRKEKGEGDSGKNLECSPNAAYFLAVTEQMGVEHAPL